jgi:hypothetical protein
MEKLKPNQQEILKDENLKLATSNSALSNLLTVLSKAGTTAAKMIFKK